MPLLNASDYRPGFFLRNAHINSMFPFLFRKQEKTPFERKRIETPDDDFLDIDFLKNGNKKVALLCHGLEGNSDSQYIHAISRILSKNGWDIAAINYRSCSGEMNRQKRFYHSGATDDIHTVIQYLEKSYDSIDIVGYSLGGNLALKFLGEALQKVSEKIRRTVAVSAPIDLGTASIEISKWTNWHYNKNFMIHLFKKIKEKQLQFPEISLKPLNKIRTLCHFDDYYTAPIHGFLNSWDYYNKSKAIQFMPKIKVPTLLINALDDPFLSKECYPTEMLEAHENIWFLAPKYGGHVGFAGEKNGHYWVEEKILWFLKGM